MAETAAHGPSTLLEIGAHWGRRLAPLLGIALFAAALWAIHSELESFRLAEARERTRSEHG